MKRWLRILFAELIFINQHNNVKNIQFLRGLHSLSIINTNGYIHGVLLDKKHKLRPALSNEFYFRWAVGKAINHPTAKAGKLQMVSPS